MSHARRWGETRKDLRRRFDLIRRQLAADPTIDNTKPKQDAMHVRRVARKTLMKRIARRQPMLDQATISKHFQHVSRAGDSVKHSEKPSADGWLAVAEFDAIETKVSVWVFSDGTYDCFGERTWRGDLKEASGAYARALGFVEALELKPRPQ